jgi:hypothetical protein
VPGRSFRVPLGLAADRLLGLNEFNNSKKLNFDHYEIHCLFSMGKPPFFNWAGFVTNIKVKRFVIID